MMFCEECGKELTGNEEKCPNCGKTVKTKVQDAQEQIEKAKTELAKEVSISNYVFKMDELIYYISSIVTILACFFPFVSASAFGTSLNIAYISGDGILVIILIIVAAVLLYLKKSLVTLILSILSLIVILFDFFNASKVTSLGASYGLGAYLLFIAGIVNVVMAVSIYSRLKKDVSK